MFTYITDWLVERGFAGGYADFLAYSAVGSLIFMASVVSNFIAKHYLLHLVSQVVKRTRNNYDDIFLELHVFERLSHLAPAMVISLLTPALLGEASYSRVVFYIDKGVALYVFLAGGFFLAAFLEALGEAYRRANKGAVPVKGYVQAAKIIVFMFVAVLAVSKVTGQNVMVLMSGLGAMTAVILLIFKDSILGLVAGIQLISNRMVSPGDWISVPSAGADGDVLDVTLTTVKVQNWDKSIAYVPIYSMVTQSFSNWRGMSESGGRRIKRSINIDTSSVRFCDHEMLNKLGKIRLLSDYIREKSDLIQKDRQDEGLEMDDLLNGRRLTNLGTFRAYVSAYLRQNPSVNKDMTFLVRYLENTSEGLPLEIYVFSNDQRWVQYEAIQADIMDHLLAIIPEFDLRVFQNPSGKDFQRFAVSE